MRWHGSVYKLFATRTVRQVLVGEINRKRRKINKNSSLKKKIRERGVSNEMLRGAGVEFMKSLI